jgi:uncharacterized membrane protein YcgQ (UPF0703/DUF1980 family)
VTVPALSFSLYHIRCSRDLGYYSELSLSCLVYVRVVGFEVLTAVVMNSTSSGI